MGVRLLRRENPAVHDCLSRTELTYHEVKRYAPANLRFTYENQHTVAEEQAVTVNLMKNGG